MIYVAIKICDKDLQFTTLIWNPDEDGTSYIEIEEGIFKYNEHCEVIQIHGKEFFPFLDLQLQWNTNNELKFKVYMEDNQKLKYFNSNSTHTKCCMKAIPFGLFKRLAKLTSINKRIVNTQIDELYPDHAKALKVAGLSPTKFPSLKEILIKNNIDKLKKKSKEDKKKKKRRNIYFCIGTCNTWMLRNTWNNIVPIHVILKRLRDKYDLKWLNVIS